MKDKMLVLAIIPARGGSKGIPKKNIKPIAGKPLIAWSIESAKKSKLIDKIVVTTDDDEIAEIAKKYGAEVIARPKELAKDDTEMLPVLQHVLGKVDAGIIVLLQPTSPIRDDDLIDKCIEEYIKNGADSLATGFYCKFNEYGTCTKPRHKLKGFFYDDGNVYVIKANLIKDGKMFGRSLGRFEMTKEQSIEIDEPIDFFIAEQILKKRVQER